MNSCPYKVRYMGLRGFLVPQKHLYFAWWNGKLFVLRHERTKWEFWGNYTETWWNDFQKHERAFAVTKYEVTLPLPRGLMVKDL